MLSILLCYLTTVSALPIIGLLMGAPLQDSFYTAPGNLSAYKNGEIFKERQIIPDFQYALSLCTTYQVAYKTEDAFGNTSHSVATVFKPMYPSQDAKILSYQFWEDSDQLNCSPSYTLAKGSLSPNAETGSVEAPKFIEFAISNGWYVVVPDHEGPQSAFMEGFIQGRNGLDGIRAAINYLELSENTPTVLYGYSGGASATVWMSNLHASYAPEINIVGAVHGGTPVDLVETVKWLDRPDRAYSGFVLAALTGMLNAYPQANQTIWPHINQSLQVDINNMRKPNTCISAVQDYAHTEFHTQMDVDFYTYKPIVDILKRESLFKNVSSMNVSTPKFPRYIFHSESDEVIPYTAIETYVHQQCASGANIQFVPWKGLSHSITEVLGIPDALQFILLAFEFKTPRVKCGKAANDTLTRTSLTEYDQIGQLIPSVLKSLNISESSLL